MKDRKGVYSVVTLGRGSSSLGSQKRLSIKCGKVCLANRSWSSVVPPIPDRPPLRSSLHGGLTGCQGRVTSLPGRRVSLWLATGFTLIFSQHEDCWEFFNPLGSHCPNSLIAEMGGTCVSPQNAFMMVTLSLCIAFVGCNPPP